MLTVKDKNLAFFEKALPDLLKDPTKHLKFAVIHGEQLQDVRDTFDAALRAAASRFPPEEFVIQQIIGQDEVINFIWAA